MKNCCQIEMAEYTNIITEVLTSSIFLDLLSRRVLGIVV